MRSIRAIASGLAAALLASLTPVVAAPPVAAEGPLLESVWSIADGVAATGNYETTTSNGGALAINLDDDAPEAQGTAAPLAAFAAQSSQTEAPGEWAMGQRNLARTGNAAWEEFISVPLRTDWTAPAGDKVQVNPAVVGDVAYFGGAGVDRTVYAVDLQDGDQVEWQITIDGSVLSAPAVTEDYVYFGGVDGRLYRVSAGRQVDGGGRQAGSFPAELDNPVGAIWGGPAVANGVVYFGARDGNVYAVDADTLEPAWDQPGTTPEGITSSVAVDNGMVIVTSGTNEWVTAFDAQTGAQLWQREITTVTDQSLLGRAPSISGSKVFLTGFDGKLYILDQNTGLDAAPPATMAARGQNTPVLAAERVFVGTNNGRVQAFDQDGVPKWTTLLPTGGIAHAPIFAEGMVFAATTNGTLYALDDLTGSILWSFTAGPMFAAPSIVSNRLLIGSDDGNLYGLEPGEPTPVLPPVPEPDTHTGPGVQDTQYYESDPVSTATGNFLHQHTDIAAIGGAGVPVAFSRTYNSVSTSGDGPLGYGWSHNLSTRLDLDSSGATLVWGDGRHDRYQLVGNQYVGPVDTHDTLYAVSGGFEVATVDDRIVGFDSSGKMTSITDRSGNTTTLTYSAGRISTVTDASARTITFGYNAAGLIASATDPVNQTWYYRYTGDDLTEVENPEGEIWTYGYDSAHRIVSIIDPDGDTLVTNTYLGTTGKVASQVDGENTTWTFTYNSDHTKVTDPTGVSYRAYFDSNFRTTRIVDDGGHQVRSIFDAADNLIGSVDTAGLLTRYAYNDEGNVTAVLDPVGHKTALSYDQDQNLTGITNLKGDTSAMTYDPSGRPATITAPTGETTTITYRSDGQVDTVSDDTGAATRYGYTANGLLASVTDPLNRITAIALRADGLPTSIKNPANETVAYTYDKANRVTTVANPKQHATTFGYDGRGMRTSVTDPRNNTTGYSYDARGLLTSVTDPLNRTTTLVYDDARRIISRTDPRSVTVTHGYDSLGRLERIALPDQPDTAVTYDSASRVATVTDGTGTTSYDYDDYGRLVAEHRDLENATLGYRYDVLGRRSTLELHRGAILAARNTYDYDASGRVTQLIDSTGGETDFDYDPVGRLASIGHANGSVTSYTYDPAGQVTQLLNLPEGLLDLQGDADPPLQAAIDTVASLNTLANELSEPENVTAVENTVTELQELIDNLSAGGADVLTVVQLLGDLADTTEALGTTIGELLDPETLASLETLVANLGETLASLPNSIQADQATDLAEDLATLASELTATATAVANEIDLLGDLLVNVLRLARAIVNSESGETELNATLDTIAALAAGLPEDLEQINATVEALAAILTDLTGAGGGLQSAWNYTYDPAGRTTQAVRRFVTTNNEQLRFTNTYAYDPAGQLTAATTTDPAVLIGGNVNYTYDPAGNRTQVAIAGTVPIDYTYDPANQLTSDTLHTYSHDAAGNLTSRTSAGQADLATTYRFDSLNRLVNVQDPTGTVVDHDYDNMGRRTSTTTTDPAGNVASDTYLYDGWDLLNTVSATGDTAYTTTAGGRVLAATTALGDTHYHPDATGNIGEATDDNGNVTTRNAYTPYGETTTVPTSPDPDDAGTQYGYSGAWGVRDAGNGLLDMRNRTYDPALGQFLSRDPLEAATGDAYAYASNAPVDRVDPLGLCSVGPVRIGFLSNDDDGCRGAGVAEKTAHVTRAVGNAPFTAPSWLWAEANNADCGLESGLLLVCANASAFANGPRAGLTMGNTIIVDEGRSIDDDFLSHEGVHATQWSLFGFNFPSMYFGAEIGSQVSGHGSCANIFEIWAGLEAGGYDSCRSSSVGPSKARK